MSESRLVYSIGAVAQMLDVPASTLRSWESRYGLVTPERSPGGHRLYTRRQVEELAFVAEQMAEGMQPGDAHRLLESRRARGEAIGRPARDVGVVLLAERDRYAAELAEYFLMTEGYETQTVFSVGDAEAAFHRDRPEVVIVDLLIAGGDGLSLCRQLKAGGRSAILAISTLDSRDDALEAGADAFLQKPVDPLDLVSVVKDMLGESAYLSRGGR